MTPLSKNARAAGLLYILSSLFGLVRLVYIPNALIVRGNASATANNIAGHELLFRDKAQREAFVMLFLNLHHQLDLGPGDPLGPVVYSVRTVGIQVAFPAANLRGLADDRLLCVFSHQL